MTNSTELAGTLQERLDADYRSAMKSRDTLVVSTIRMAKAAIQNAQVAKGGVLDDNETLEVLARQAKMRRESIAEFERGRRPDLASKEAEELGVLERYLPAPLSEVEIRAIVAAAIADVNPAGGNTNAAVGQTMRLVMPKLKGRAEGSLVNTIVREALAAHQKS